MKGLWSHIILLLITGSALFSQNSSRFLNSGWEFRQDTESVWHKATVPGSVHQDLYKNHIIPDPFYADNDKKVQWIEEKNWEYRTEFEVSKNEWTSSNILLEFEGLDTYARVFLNEKEILNADNMFRPWTAEVKMLIHPGKNKLRIVFQSALLKGKKMAAQIPYTLPEGERVFTRKAQYHYGWDFAPRLLGCGIWKPVKIHFYSKARISALTYQIRTLTPEKAELDIFIETQVARSGNYFFKTTLAEGASGAEKSISVSEAGIRLDTLKMTIPKPRLWWCQGYGEAFLYDLKVELRSKAGTENSRHLSIGLRKIELDRSLDSLGISFVFKLNGLPVFAKGANLVPSGLFPERALTDEQLVSKARELGMNMLRVWGGGVYASDEFYEACDKNGILVWQDLMFACAMYPGDPGFLNSVKQEVEYNLKRIASHPSLALVCGNNESDEGWNNWGWQKQFAYSYKDSISIWKDYQNLFHEIVPGLKNKFAPDIPYSYSSPAIGWGHKESLTNYDSHYWGVWWGDEAFSEYRKKVGRFVSEYGFQSLPDYSTLQQFSPREDLRLNSASMNAHQKNGKGDKTIRLYMERDYKMPDSLFQFCYVSQLLQRDGMQMAIEAHRSDQPRCMGSLFWQFNDCWPAVSWSAIDFYGRPKAFAYALKRLFAPILITAEIQNRKIDVKLVSDSSVSVSGDLYTVLSNFKGEVLWNQKTEIALKRYDIATSSILLNDLPAFDSSDCFLSFKFVAGTDTLAQKHLFFTSPKNLRLPTAPVRMTKISERELELSCPVFVKDVYIYSDEQFLDLNENYFDLEPGIKKILRLRGKDVLPSLLKIKCLSLNDI